MKRGILCLAWILSAVFAHADDTALQALKALKDAKGDELMTHLVEMTGDGGNPQPNRWKALFNDPSARGGVREIVIENNAISSERTPLRGFAGTGDMPVVNAAEVKVDSDKLFHMADNAALNLKVGFHTLDYALRAGEKSNQPVWTIHLYDKMGASIGKMEISAVTGSVIQPLAVDSDYRNTASSNSSESKSWDESGGLIGKAQDLGQRTGTSIKHTVQHVGGSIQEFFTGERTIDADSSPTPGNSSH